MARADISFVVPVFNRWDLTRPMLDSLLACTHLADGSEIVVVDDGSAEETRSAVAALRVPFRPVLNASRLGFAAAVNQAVATIDSPLFALLNSDLVLRPGWLEPMLTALEEHPECFCTGNLQLSVLDGSLDHAGVVLWQGGFPVHFRDALDFVRYRKVREFPAVTAACCVFRRGQFMELGGFDTRFRNGFEDIDLCLRARTRGWSSLVANTSEVGHHIASSPGRHDSESANAHHFRIRWQPLTAILERDWEERIVQERGTWKRFGLTTDSVTSWPTPVAVEAQTRVLVDLARMAPAGGNGGIILFVKELVRHLHRLYPGRHRFLFLIPPCVRDETLAFAGEDDEIWLLPNTSESTSAAPDRVRQLTIADGNLARSLCADLLFAPLSVSDFWSPDLPAVSIAVDVLHRDLPECLPPEDVPIREIWFDRMVTYSHTVICISEWVAARVREQFPIAPSRLVVARPVVHARISRCSSSETAGPRVFLYPANAWPHKNHDTLLVAYRLYRRAVGHPAWDLVLTGKRDEAMDRIEKRATDLGIGDFVQVCGHLPEPEFAQLLARTGALVFPSLHEGFGIPVLEAMHLGLPIIAGRVGSIPEVAGDACCFVDVRDPFALGSAMEELWRNPDRCADLSIAGRRRAAAFDFDHEVHKVAAVFQLAVADFDRAGITWRAHLQ